MAIRKLTGVLLLTASMGVIAAEPADDAVISDPFEGLNRAVFVFNDALDTYALRPIALGYRYITPDFVETGVSNFFDNLADVSNVLNNGLQGKFADAGTDLSRLVFNTTIGLLGLFDVATEMGLAQHDEDFGQTLGVWGVSSGPYLMLPLLGPSTVRDTAGLVVDYTTDPVNWLDDQGDKNAASLVRIVDGRSRLLASESLISGDKYSFIRDAYLQRREFAISDGEITDFDDSNF